MFSIGFTSALLGFIHAGRDESFIQMRPRTMKIHIFKSQWPEHNRHDTLVISDDVFSKKKENQNVN